MESDGWARVRACLARAHGISTQAAVHTTPQFLSCLLARAAAAAASTLICAGVSKAVEMVNTEIARMLAGEDPAKQADLDRAMIELDGTPNKGRLGANAILGASLAIAKAGAAAEGRALWEHFGALSGRKPSTMCLPTPSLNVINGGEVRRGPC